MGARDAVVHPVVVVVAHQVVAVGEVLARRRIEIVVVSDGDAAVPGDMEVLALAGLGLDLAHDLAV